MIQSNYFQYLGWTIPPALWVTWKQAEVGGGVQSDSVLDTSLHKNETFITAWSNGTSNWYFNVQVGCPIAASRLLWDIPLIFLCAIGMTHHKIKTISRHLSQWFLNNSHHHYCHHSCQVSFMPHHHPPSSLSLYHCGTGHLCHLIIIVISHLSHLMCHTLGTTFWMFPWSQNLLSLHEWIGLRDPFPPQWSHSFPSVDRVLPIHL
jgi:hypothetical protein